MTQDMTKDMILHTMTKKLVCNWRTRVLSAAHSSSLTSALIQRRNLCADEILASLRWQASETRVTAHSSRDYVSIFTRLRLVVMMLLMMVLGVNISWGQDYSGVYYIVNDNSGGPKSGSTETTAYSDATDEIRWYLVPARNPQQADKRDAWYSPSHSNTTPGDSNKPFLTTYQNNKDKVTVPDDIPANNSVWIVKKTSDGCYNVIHAATGKYVIYEVPLPNDPNYNTKPTEGENGKRKTMHLQTPDNETYSLGNNENYKFTITRDGEENNYIYRIQPKNRSGWYWNPANGNKDKYYGQTSSIYQAGLVGVYNNADDGGSKWRFDDVSFLSPSISDFDLSTNKVTVTENNGLPAGYNIRYTFSSEGTPDDPTALTETYIVNTDGSANEIIINEPGTLKVVIERYGVLLTAVEEKTIVKVATPSIINDGTNIVIDCTTNGATIYYTIDDSDPLTSENRQTYTDPIPVSSSNLNKTFRAIAVKDGCFNSEEGTPLTVTATCPMPTISFSNSSGEITLECSDAEATIYYTLDGVTSPDPNQVGESNPTKQYDSADKPTISATTTIKAIATKAEYANSSVKEVTIEQLAAPSLAFDDTNLSVIITTNSTIEGVSTVYTDTGADPITTSTPYTDAIILTDNTTIKAMNVKEGYVNSEIVSLAVDLSTTGYAGIYYIRNNANTGDYYMYPVGGTSTLVTTAPKTDQNAIWKIKRVGDYYRIIHYKDGKYLVAKDVVNGVMADTETVSLVATDSPGENALFEITRKSGEESDIIQQIILIRPKAATDATTTEGHKYLNKRGGNLTSDKIGLWNNTGSSEWQLATVPAKPTFTVNGINVTISSDLGNVYYTIDGTTPTSSSTQGENVTLDYGPSYRIKAICIYHDDISGTDWTSEVATSDPIQVDLLNPIITRSGSNVTINNSQASSVTFRYTFSDDGTFPADPVPDGAGTDYASALPLTANARNVFKAIAYKTVNATTYTSGVVTFDVDLRSATTISSLAGITSATGSYKLASGFSATGTPEEGGVKIGTSTNPFKGTIDGQLVTITGTWNQPLFDYVQDATIKNVIISKATISTSGNAGAICNEADGATKIYNCGINSGSVKGSGNVGGLVGLIKSDSKVRVVNCYNYADVSSTGEYAAGIVGKNEGTIASNKTVGDVRIALCMMYGSVSGATHRSPVYGGNHVSNLQNFTEYNYYLYSNERDTDGKIIKKINYTSGDYNDQLAIEKDDYLTRFPFYRHILNTHRELAAFFLFGAPTTNSARNITSAQVEEIGHWVVKKGANAPKYPVVEAWGKNTRTTPYYNSSTDNNYTPPTTTDDYAGKLLTDMGNDGIYKGYLKVTVKMSSDHTVYLPITDMDTLRYDYNYGKVILPFANEYEVNTDYTRICTGWKITDVDGITSSSVSNYNFADRDNKQKDIYDSNNPYIFAQGGYYIVPTGVKSIEITPNYATAYYLSDASYDVGLNTSYGGETPLGGTVPNGANAFHGQTVYTSLSDALDAMGGTTNNPHQRAIVLVGNYHFDGAGLTDTKAFTFMSIDEDCNQEPDYGFYMYNKYDRPTAPAMRFDFLPVIPVGWAAHVAGSGGFKGVPIWKVRGWFEITETCVFYTDQCEIDSQNFKETNNGKGNNPWVINGGYFVQIVRSNKNSTGCNRVSYIKMGGNVYVREFYPGAHSEVSGKITKIVPVNVTGGEIKECFMTGYNSKCSAEGENIQFWCAGGKIHKFLGAYMDKPTSETVNVTANIDHALITRFYGGGTSAEASITGEIEVTITNSKVDFYCGGPEFSSLTAKPTVTTIASNTIFGQYYGAGFGGTSITYNLSKQESGYAIGSDKVTFPISFSTYYKRLQKLTEGGKTLGTCYKLEYIHHSRQQQLVARFFTGYAEFSLATTGSVINTLDGCTIKSDFYGAGCQGKVDGTVNSTLTNCKVDGSVYGGGYKATANEVEVYTTTQPEYSIYDKETAIFSEFGTVAPQTYTWNSGTAGTANEGSKILYTDAPMGQLGVVTDNITLTIKGKKSDATYTVKNNVFGGGNESPSEKKATVVIEDYVDGNNNTSGAVVQGSVYGGGNEAPIGTDSKVTLKGNTNVQGNVFGGGNMGVVNGSASVEIKENE